MSVAALKQATGTQVATTRERPSSFPAMLEAYKAEIARALPRHLNPDTMARVALTCFRMNPRLAECAPASVFAAVIQASQLGLRPGLLGECYLIPYKQECTLQIGYQGMLELVRRSGLVDSLGAYVVYERDTYQVRFGTDPGVEHSPFLDGDRGGIRFVYAVAHIKGGGKHVEVMTLGEVQKIRDRSQNVQNARRSGKKTPWDTDFEEMARKTVLRRICKYLPKSNELALAMALDDAAHAGSQGLTMQSAIDSSWAPAAIDVEATETDGGDGVSTGAPATDPGEQVSEQAVRDAIRDAADQDALEAAGQLIQFAPKESQTELGNAYAARLKALRAA